MRILLGLTLVLVVFTSAVTNMAEAHHKPGHGTPTPTPTPPPPQVCTSVLLSVSPSPPRAPGVVVTNTASSVAGCNNPEYRFWVQRPGFDWEIIRDYAPAASALWDTTGLSDGVYLLEVHVRQIGSGAYLEANDRLDGNYTLTSGLTPVACFDIDGQSNQVYENLIVGPCPTRAGIMVRNSTNITLRNLTVFEGRTNIEAFQSSVFIEGVTLRDPQGPFPRGQQVLFDQSTGSLRNSTLTFVSGFQEDAVNLWYSNDVLIEGNNIGGGSSPTGCGILVHYGVLRATVRNNEVHHIQCGIGIAGGQFGVIDNNNVHDYTGYGGSANIGLYLWNQGAEPCTDNQVINNRVSPATNAYWNANNCSNTTWTNNTVY